MDDAVNGDLVKVSLRPDYARVQSKDYPVVLSGAVSPAEVESPCLRDPVEETICDLSELSFEEAGFMAERRRERINEISKARSLQECGKERNGNTNVRSLHFGDKN